MNVKEITKRLAKAGINARPKAVYCIRDHIQALNQAISENTNSDNMQTDFDEDSVISLVISKFSSLKMHSSSGDFLEENVVKQIFNDYLSLESLNKISSEAIKTEEPGALKSFKSVISQKVTSTEEVKDMSITDPIVNLLNNKVIILDAFEHIPKPIKVRNLLEYKARSQHATTLISQPQSRIDYHSLRLKFIENLFRSQDTSREINTVILEGIITRGQNIIKDGVELKSYYLENEDFKVKLDLSEARSDKTCYFTEGSVVRAEGIHKGKCFHASYISQPPYVPKQTTADIVKNDSFGAYTYLKTLIETQHQFLSTSTFEQLKDVPKGEDEAIIVLSNIHLDDENDMKSLNEVMSVYDQMPNVSTFILCGDFISKRKVDTAEYDDLRLDYKQLADCIKQYPRLKSECRFIIVPGPNDPGSDGILPSMQAKTFLGNPDDIEPEFMNDDFNGIKNITFASNPCRISFFGKQIVVSRYDYFKKIKKNRIHLGGDGPIDDTSAGHNEFEMLAKTVLSQANLSPLSYLTQPLYWDYAEALNIRTMPDYLILADTSPQYTVNKQEEIGTTILNPGNYTFTVLYPHKGESEENSLHRD